MNKIQCPVNAGAQHFNNLPALIAGDMTISYGDYEQFVATTAVNLQEAGIAGGERVAIISGNRWDYPILLFALWRAGAVACPISPRFPGEAIRGLLKKIDCGVIVDPKDKVSNGKAGIRKIGMDLIQRVKTSDLAKAPAPVTWDLDNDATIIFTSGSSAQPKAVLHTLSNHYFSALGSNKNIPVEAADRWLLSLPLFHVGGIGILFRMALGGGAVVISAEKEPPAESMTRYEITHLSLVSTQLHRLLNDPPSAEVRKHLKALLAGGSAVSSSMVSKAHEAGLPVYTTYGLTEMASQVTTTGPREALERVPNSGRVLDYRQLKIDDGEILVRGGTLFKGYV
ncbi:MAG: AMP-binding protein, partial [Deltaproteobacteria bacterium]|nr:AMP-binding protein [Deltaproteobacteria bacterium]